MNQREDVRVDEEAQMLLPLDERFRRAEQFQFDFPVKEVKPRPAEMRVCIGNCKICPYCDGE